MNHEVNTFYPKDKSLLAFHSYMEGKKKKKRERKKQTTKKPLAGVRLASRGRKRNLDVNS